MIADDYLLTLLRQGEKLQAVKVYRDETGCSLKEAKDYIDHLEQDMRYATLRKAPDMEPDEEVLRLIRQGEKLMAVKIFKERTGCDLIVAKDLIDELYKQIGPKSQPQPTSSFKEWSEQQVPSNSFEWPSRDGKRRSQSRSTKAVPSPRPTAYDDRGGHYDKGERNGCLGMLLMFLSPFF